MICGLGIDIIEINRIRNVIEKHGENFINKTFTQLEQEYCKKYRDPVPRYAARFSAKEAFVKAFGSGFNSELTFLDIEIYNNDFGKPFINLSPKIKNSIIGNSIDLSMSHCKNYATAVVIISSNCK